ncbi:MAG: hypothetical protein HC825_09025 [Oscillatoriales cyanobacterium RM1_1_9]|nr:hypothetical protein [Oscillatoriales cyanobacterium SM2_3_0]NJO45827.1 hypothetical protein [Oscillatoriales cyanobacterium RM2_1_1]NJO71769.1 hypothetical protein [Oscillatoriales cyanobacterium RM1_1_9]
MASHQQVKQYLSHWLQLGKRIVIRNGEEFRQPQPVIEGDRFSKAFEDCWQEVIAAKAGTCYLEGTDQTIAELLTAEWIVEDCARCEMPVPMRIQGSPPTCCPCTDLPTWPNEEIPRPRLPVSSQTHLHDLCHRLTQTATPEDS